MALSARRLRSDETELVRALRIPPDSQAVFPMDIGGEGEEWGLWLDDQLIGWCRLVGRPPVLWVSRILIDAPYTGLGYGRVFLIKVLEEVRRSWRWREVRAAVHPQNTQARRLFEGLGFKALPHADCIGEIILQKIFR